MSIIEKKRRDKGLTQTQLAEHMNVDQTAVSKWERGACLPSGNMLVKLSRFFNCTIDELLGDGAASAMPVIMQDALERMQNGEASCNDIRDEHGLERIPEETADTQLMIQKRVI